MALNPDAAYTLKLGRAQKHLDELNLEIAAFSEDHPCVPVRDRQTKPNVWRIAAHLAQKPAPDIALIVGDVVHNLRSALDHMARALRPDKRNTLAQYPILRDDIWADKPSPGEEVSDRVAAWERNVKGMDTGAVAIIKESQPYLATGPGVHPLRTITALNNADKHFELADVQSGIAGAETTLDYSGADGTFHLIFGGKDPSGIVFDGGIVGELRVHNAALQAVGIGAQRDRTFILDVLANRESEVNVKIVGTPKVGIRLRELQNDQVVLPLPDVLEHSLASLRDLLFPELEPFVK